MPLEITRTIDGEEYLTAWLRRDDGARFVAKARPHPFPHGEAQWQRLLFDRLAGADLGFQTPALVRDRAGGETARLAFDDVRAEAIMLTWVDGEPLSSASIQPDAAMLHDLGRISAVLTSHLANIDAPYGRRTHPWRMSHVRAVISDALDLNLPRTVRRQIDGILDFHDHHVPDFGRLPQATVHQDLNRHNVTVDPEDPRAILGVIDFNDAVRTARVADIAIAVASAAYDQEHPLEAMAATAAGYQSVLQLTDAEREALLPLAVSRLAASWLVWARRADGDADSYAGVRMRDTFPVIEQLLDIGLESAQRQLRAQL
ncbi:phosphotransferase [Microbacterium sp. MC2]